jgi:hypothetical protein
MNSLENRRPGNPDELLTAIDHERTTIFEAELFHDVEEIPNIPRPVSWRRSAVDVDAHGRVQAIEKQHVPAETLEAEQVLQEDPGMATDPGPQCKSARNNDGSAAQDRVSMPVCGARRA